MNNNHKRKANKEEQKDPNRLGGRAAQQVTQATNVTQKKNKKANQKLNNML